MRRLAAFALVAALIAAACSSSSNNSSSNGTTSGSKSLKVNVDGKAPDHNEAFLSYFPKEVSAHPGDTVTFDNVGNGEPHTVTFGTLTDAAVAAAEKDPNAQNPPPEDAKLPQLLPQGPGDAIQSAAQPCYLPSGDPPATDPCTADQQKLTDFTGTQTYYNSGWLAPNDTFVVKLSSSVKPGTYRWMCLLHRETMSGTLTVVAKGTSVPTVSEQTAKGAAELATAAGKAKPAADALAGGTLPDLGFLPKTAQLAGGLTQAEPNVEIAEFGKKDVTIPTGGSVTWIVVGPHTISFNAPADATQLKINGSHLNEKAAAPAPQGAPGQPPPAQTTSTDPNAPPPAPTIVDAGTWDGVGYHSSGIFASFPPALDGYKITFSKPGTYTYKCLIHDKMEGTVKVT
jgi:plastocyanin